MSKSHNVFEAVAGHLRLGDRLDPASFLKGDSRAMDDAIYREIDVVTKWLELLKDVLTDF